MGNWQASFVGLKQLPRELTAFEIEAFFTFTLAERQLIEDRRRPALKLRLALRCVTRKAVRQVPSTAVGLR